MKLTRDDFECWLMEMDNRLARLKKLLPRSVHRQLDYTPDSLLALERWLLSKYAAPNDILAPPEKAILDCLDTYVGETIRKTVGGKWNIELENEEDAYYHLPVIEKDDDWVESPATLITSCLDRRTGHHIFGVVQALREE